MSRCQHCHKLTHSEDLYVTFSAEDIGKVYELRSLQLWTPKYMYDKSDLQNSSKEECGKLKCGDIWIHFIQKD